MSIYKDGYVIKHGGVVRKTVPCKLCGSPTEMTGTKLCDGCWELRNRVWANPDLARRLLDDSSD